MFSLAVILEQHCFSFFNLKGVYAFWPDYIITINFFIQLKNIRLKGELSTCKAQPIRLSPIVIKIEQKFRISNQKRGEKIVLECA